MTKSAGVDMAAAPALILSGFGVRPPSQTHRLKLCRPEYVHYSRLHGANCPQTASKVNQSGTTFSCGLAPKPFVGRTRLGVNQGDRKRYIRGALETGAQGKTGLVDTLGARPATKEGEAFLIMSSDWYQAGVEAENLLRVS